MYSLLRFLSKIFGVIEKISILSFFLYLLCKVLHDKKSIKLVSPNYFAIFHVCCVCAIIIFLHFQEIKFQKLFSIILQF